MSARREGDLERRKAAEAELRKRAARLRRGVDKILRDEDCSEVFKFLHDICGWAKSSTVIAADGRVDAEGTAYNEARRDVYLRLRALATRSFLTPVEESAETGQSADALEAAKETEKEK